MIDPQLTEESQLYYGKTPSRPERLAGGRLMTSAEFDENKSISEENSLSLPCSPLVEVTDAGLLECRPYAGYRFRQGELERHLAVIGSTGSGKDMRVLMNMFARSLAETFASQFIVSTKGPADSHLYGLVAEKLAPDAESIVIAPGDPASPRSMNILQEYRDLGMVQTLVDTVSATNHDRRGDGTWFRSVASKVFGMVVASPHINTLAEAVQITSDQYALARFAEETHNDSLREQLQFVSSGSNGQTSWADIETMLSPYKSDAAQRAVLSADVPTLSLAKTMQSGKRVVIILECNEQTLQTAMHAIRLITTLLFSLTTKIAEKNQGRMPRALHMHINEFPAMGRLVGFENFITTARSRGVSVNLYVQSSTQLASIYGSDVADTILSNCGCKLFLLSGIGADRYYLSNLTGEQRVTDVKVTEVLDPATGDYVPTSRELSIGRKPVLSPDEISELATRPHPVFGPFAVLLPVDRPPLLTHLTPSFEIPWLARLIDRSRNDGPARKLLPEVAPMGLAEVVLKRIGDEKKRLAEARKQAEQQKLDELRADDRWSSTIPELRERVGWSTALEDVRAWWRKVEENHSTRPEDIEHALKTINDRGCSLAMLYYYASSNRKARNSLKSLLAYHAWRSQGMVQNSGPAIPDPKAIVTDADSDLDEIPF